MQGDRVLVQKSDAAEDRDETKAEGPGLGCRLVQVVGGVGYMHTVCSRDSRHGLQKWETGIIWQWSVAAEVEFRVTSACHPLRLAGWEVTQVSSKYA